jgi:hypothetical protein
MAEFVAAMDDVNAWIARHPRFRELVDELAALGRDEKWMRMVALEQHHQRLMGALADDPDLFMGVRGMTEHERLKAVFVLPAAEEQELDALYAWYRTGKEAILKKYGWPPKPS